MCNNFNNVAGRVDFESSEGRAWAGLPEEVIVKLKLWGQIYISQVNGGRTAVAVRRMK